MANDIKFESFAIYVFIKQAEGEPETPAETVRGEDTVAVIFPRKGLRPCPRKARVSPAACALLCSCIHN